MSVNQKIESALNGITKNIWPLCCPDEHSPDVYIVYNPEIEMPGYHADDTDMEWVQYMQIHRFQLTGMQENQKLLPEENCD